MNIAVVPATRADTLVVDRLGQLCTYDFSEYGGIGVDSNGVFPTTDDDTDTEYPVATFEAAARARNGQVDGIGDHVREVEQIERGLVGDAGGVLANGQPGGRHLVVQRRGKVPQPVEAAPDVQEASLRCSSLARASLPPGVSAASHCLGSA